jgi:hypothetical protein
MAKETKFKLELYLLRENERLNTYLNIINQLTKQANDISDNVKRVEVKLKKKYPEYVEK